MRSIFRLSPILLTAACGNACAITKALYVAVVHNSGAPPRDELARADEREATFLRDRAHNHVIVLPVAVLRTPVRYDTAAARAIAERLGGANVATDEVHLPFEPQPNEAVILWSRFRALGDSVRAHPRGDDYVMQVDVIGEPDAGRIVAVHVMVVTGQGGEMAYRRLWNSHQPLYKEVRPTSLDDVARMIATDVARR